MTWKFSVARATDVDITNAVTTTSTDVDITNAVTVQLDMQIREVRVKDAYYHNVAGWKYPAGDRSAETLSLWDLVWFC